MGATISWTTNSPADSQVEYGVTTSYGNVVSRKTPVTSHQENLFGLTPNTLYHYRVKSLDSSGKLATSGDLTFKTAVSGSPTPTPTATPSPGVAELPRVFLDTGIKPSTGQTINVAAGQSVQAAIDLAQPGDVIMLQAGATFTGNFRLPNKTTGSGWITIRTTAADADLSPPLTRVTPAKSAFMPKLVSTNGESVMDTDAGAHHYRFIGIEFGVAAGVDITNIISFGGDQTSLAATPHNLIIDRCYIHGNNSRNARRGVMLNSASTAIIDSHISNIHEVGADSQAVCGWNGPGPFKIVNNYLEGAGENVMFGGAAPLIQNLIASDIEFRLNTVRKDPSWRGSSWSIKNLFELKNAQRLLVDQNVFENNWADDQVGFAVLFTPRGEGVAPWATVADVTFTNNIVRHSGSGINIAGRDDTSPSQPSQRILIQNNVLEDINSGNWGGDGRALLIVGGPVNITVDHNTFFQSGAIIAADGGPSQGFIFRNNIAPHNDLGVWGSGQGVGLGALNFYFPGAIFQKNVIAGVPQGVEYPPNNFYPASLNDVGFVNLAGGDFRLAPTSPFRNAGTDGKDIGALFN